MNNLKKLNEQFLSRANRPLSFNEPPIHAKKSETPVFATERWNSVNDSLVKTYQFRRDNDRDKFVVGLLSYEQDVKHHAVITIEGNKVAVKVTTHDVDRVTELDKNYAAFCDVLFREVVYDSSYGT